MLEDRTSAIVLRGRLHGESDKIVTFLTKDWGKVTGIAKGAKRSQRRFVNVLEPFTHVQLRFRPSRPHHADELAFIFGCDLLQSFRGPSRDLQRFAIASYCSELIDVMVTGREAGEEIYALLRDSLQGLETTEPISSVFLCTFELLLLAHTGYAPHLSDCQQGGRAVEELASQWGFASTWDYGPLGIELKRNIREAWWRYMVTGRENVVGLDSAILMHPRVWEASGHVAGFSDPLVDCRVCKRRFRADHIPPKEERQCPKGAECDLTEARQFNLMFKTFVGPVEEDASVAFLRPETAQGIFVNFLNVQQASRLKPPFGIAQIGKSFRNEITPGNFIFRTREFEQMEMEFFVKPGTEDEWFQYWRAQRMNWYTSRLGVKPANLRFYDHPKEDLAHYSKGTTDIEYLYPFGWGELEGIANRTDFDLRQHADHSGKDLTFFYEETRERYRPYMIDPPAGVERIRRITLPDAYDEDGQEGEAR